MFSVLDDVSIIIPTAPNETAHLSLIEILSKTDAQIIVSSENGRAQSMNIGAQKAEKQYLWFLHADTFLTDKNLSALENSLQQYPEALHYFPLKFTPSGLPSINGWGANIRSILFGLPYGDQAFCLLKEKFYQMGGYDENTPYGEDLLFIRKIKKRGVNLKKIPSYLLTSARTYQYHGWLKTTLLYQWRLQKLLRVKL